MPSSSPLWDKGCTCILAEYHRFFWRLEPKKRNQPFSWLRRVYTQVPLWLNMIILQYTSYNICIFGPLYPSGKLDLCDVESTPDPKKEKLSELRQLKIKWFQSFMRFSARIMTEMNSTFSLQPNPSAHHESRFNAIHSHSPWMSLDVSLTSRWRLVDVRTSRSPADWWPRSQSHDGWRCPCCRGGERHPHSTPVERHG